MREPLVVLSGILSNTAFGSAHHSGAAVYAPNETVEIEGRLTRIFWCNPRVPFVLEATDVRARETEWNVASNSTLAVTDAETFAEHVGRTFA